ncbi:glycosyl hydrolase [Amycolatopsis carbonis]|uniref:Glycosyl hydrolase n=1 Tax=Amycolatopsis carbonis TaxID=715471 RepID=A0A9Y2I827_9PSEU|nr:glycosyl hydrolase [Amycolatopsis sp. 2-15]WIX75500.1 glycosyl hydrolase [Amycolatopsis sp. 2-15]
MSTSRRGFLRGAAVVALGAAGTAALPGTAAEAAGELESAAGLSVARAGGAEPAHLALPRLASAMDGSDVLGGFRTPPAEVLPRVWWHWMNQNITQEGIKADLEWFKRAGIGGMVNFDGAGRVPVVVPNPLPYMSDGWKSAFRYAMQQADRLGLEADVACSPGWSETGGPWVTAEDAMKKYVWTETWVAGGRGQVKLPQPPAVAGQFADSAAASSTPTPLPAFYRDARVFAYRVPNGTQNQAALAPKVFASGLQADPKATPTSNGDQGVPLDVAKLSNASVADAQYLPAAGGAGTWVRFEYQRPVAVTGVTIAAGAAFSGWNDVVEYGPSAQVYSSRDGRQWTLLAQGVYSGVQRTLFVPQTTAKYFKVVFGQSSTAPSSAPIALASLILRTVATVHEFEVKAGFGQTANYYHVATPSQGGGPAVRRSDVVDLTGRMAPDGTLNWRAPGGTWVVVRLGYSLTGHQNGPASTAATGLEVDKLDAGRVRKYLNTYLDMLTDAAGKDLFGRRGLTGLLNDSYEAGYQNWTESLLDEFRKRRGYDPAPHLPVLTGVPVDSAADADKFLWDWRRTLNELLAQNHYQIIPAEAHKRGIQRTYAEAQEDKRGWFGDDMEMRQYADFPMGASGEAFAPGDQSFETYRVDTRGAASVAHIYGRPQAAVEAFTFTPQGFTPKDLKPLADEMLAQGATRFMIHTSVHQPLDRGPGVTLNGIGSFFTRLETWAEVAKPWTTYLSRCSWLLSRGTHVADVAYFYGQEAPATGVWGRTFRQTDQPIGYDYDFVNGTVILNEMSVRDRRIVTRSGQAYALLQLGGDAQRITLAVLRKLAGFVDAGAAIAGPKPLGSPSLADDDAEFQKLATRLWGDGEERDRVVGAGRVFSGVTAAEALAELGVTPDWTFRLDAMDPLTANEPLWLTHRRTDSADIYFIVNRRNVRTTIPLTLRSAGSAVETWDPVSGQTAPITFDATSGATQLTVDLGPADSIFLVVSHGKPGSKTVAVTADRQIGAIAGAWQVDFPADRGAPAKANFAYLRSFTQESDPGIRYFSGTATYSTTFDAPAEWAKLGGRVILDLGEVHDIAQVTINGADAGIAWRAPYRLDITGALRGGRNTLQVKVTNSWFNRLVGDQQPGATPIAYVQPPLKNIAAGTELKPAGLLGPVRIVNRA